MTRTPRITNLRLDATEFHKSIPDNATKNLLWFL